MAAASRCEILFNFSAFSFPTTPPLSRKVVTAPDVAANDALVLATLRRTDETLAERDGAPPPPEYDGDVSEFSFSRGGAVT
jgi:hypothetical protein